MSYKKDIDPRSRSKLVEKLSSEFQKLISIYRKNFYHAQKLQKQANDRGTKTRSYVPGDKVCLNSKYLKTKQNQKLKFKFFNLFQVLYLVGKQAYKLKLPKKWKIYNTFYILLLEQDTTRKGKVDENAT